MLRDVPRGAAFTSQPPLPAFLLAGIVDGGVASTARRVLGSRIRGASSGDHVHWAEKECARMTFEDVTPNLVVAAIDASIAFYRDVLGFAIVTTVPEQAPFAFAWMQRDTV